MKPESDRRCRQLPNAPAWVMHALGPREARRFTAHLAHCAQCAAEVRATRGTLDMIHATSPAAPQPELTARILRAVAADETRPQDGRRSSFTLAVYGAVAAAVVFLIGLVVWRQATIRQAESIVQLAGSMDFQMRQAADWIAAQQEPDGTWYPSRTGGNDAYRPALTGLSLLALQRQAPETHAGAIERAVTALVALQIESGAFCRTPGAQRYNHAFAAYALLSLPDAMLRTPAVQAACNRAIAYAQRTQTSQGAWDYTDDGSGNTALSAWQLAVLLQARLRGWPDHQGHLRRGLAWLRQQTDGHAFGYRSPGTPLAGGSGLTLTAMAASTLLEAALTFPTLQPEAVAAVSALNTLREDIVVESEDYYRDYFLAKVSEQQADHGLMAEVCTRLARRGDPVPGGVRWSATDAWGRAGGDLYATSMAVLSRRF